MRTQETSIVYQVANVENATHLYIWNTPAIPEKMRTSDELLNAKIYKIKEGYVHISGFRNSIRLWLEIHEGLGGIFPEFYVRKKVTAIILGKNMFVKRKGRWWIKRPENLFWEKFHTDIQSFSMTEALELLHEEYMRTKNNDMGNNDGNIGD